MPLARAHLIVKGLVQGVFFRGFVRGMAVQLGVSGFVRNLGDGSVEAVFEGEKALVEKAIAECKKGPPGARVDDIEVRWEPPAGDLGGFTVRY
jgi:acylphosphatase